jgi:peptide/nickel transport system permease protein
VARFVLARIASSLVLLVVVSFILYSFVYLAPGNPTAVLTGGHPIPPDQLAALRAHYHLDDPFLAQFGYWFVNVLQGDFGPSISAQAPVSDVIGPRIAPTLELALYASLLVLLFGVGGGIVAAVKRGKATDVVISGTMLVGASIAQYVSAIVLIVVFSSHLGWFPVFGLGSGFTGRIDHLTLPAIALALSLCAFVGRITRAAMIDSLELEHVETARSRGFSRRSIILRHALRSALIPVVTVGGLAIGYLITGAVIVEFTFGLNGLGSTLISAIQDKDFAVVQAIALLFTVVFLVANLVADLLYVVIDPRVRLGARGGGR